MPSEDSGTEENLDLSMTAGVILPYPTIPLQGMAPVPVSLRRLFEAGISVAVIETLPHIKHAI